MKIALQFFATFRDIRCNSLRLPVTIVSDKVLVYFMRCYMLFSFLFFKRIYIRNIVEILTLTLSPTDGPYGPMTNSVKSNFSGGKVQNNVNVLMAVFHNSLRFHLIFLAMLPSEKHRFIWVLKIG